MRKIVLLEKDAGSSVASKKSLLRSGSWGIRQRLLLLGGIALAVSCVAGGFAWAWWPSPPTRQVDFNAIHRDMMALTPLQSMEAWKALTYTPLGSLATKMPSPAVIVFYQQKLGEQRSLALVSAIAGVLALAFLVGSLMAGKSGQWSEKN